ncbi:sigma-54-dependent Fis family transcriptional regulator [candidate division KSB1 bacterium]|nr:sigma-54-dependent Fis family transcriptional regulator [candidate division KSB1 bacterium]
MKPQILIVDDEEHLSFFLKSALETKNFMVETASSLERAKVLLASKFPDLLLLDLNLPDGNGLDLYRLVRENGMGIPTIVITAFGSIKSAIEALKLGVDDYIIKPFELDELIVNIENQLERFKLNNQFNYYKRILHQRDQENFFVSTLPEIVNIQNLAFKIAQVEESTILIEGASGTGKEMLARYIHQKSPLTNSPFIEINCASLPEHLLESELFGYEPGAFTDAKRRKIGLIELAHGGTLFLDEISEMQLSLQAKILRAIETRTFKRLGGIRDIKLKLRIIAATNQDIRSKIEQKLFREDLFFRLNMFHIKLPTLLERKAEILLIARFFLEKIANQLRRPVRHISTDAQRLILDYSWPGNQRELRNTIERAVILCESDTIEPQHLPCELRQKSGAISIPPGINVLQNQTLRQYLDSIEKNMLQQALQLSNGNQLKAAEILGEPRHILRYLLKKHSIKG